MGFIGLSTHPQASQSLKLKGVSERIGDFSSLRHQQYEFIDKEFSDYPLDETNSPALNTIKKFLHRITQPQFADHTLKFTIETKQSEE
ncbi:unnamed protein product [Schistosoma mattheei]|uniref:Uncharacterized protein n=1 Tax=Schistosoma mattheei TaxID=31246 RepID=A0A183NM10_9TREM|nr:unnamed protein product [Schistosoma mattheei]